jgi:hypothetical protein
MGRGSYNRAPLVSHRRKAKPPNARGWLSHTKRGQIGRDLVWSVVLVRS